MNFRYDQRQYRPVFSTQLSHLNNGSTRESFFSEFPPFRTLFPACNSLTTPPVESNASSATRDSFCCPFFPLLGGRGNESVTSTSTEGGRDEGQVRRRVGTAGTMPAGGGGNGVGFARWRREKTNIACRHPLLPLFLLSTFAGRRHHRI